MPSFARLLRGIFVGSLVGALFVALFMSLLGFVSYFGMLLVGAFAFLTISMCLIHTPLLVALHNLGWRSWSAVGFAGALSVMLGFALVEWISRGSIGPVAFTIRPVETIVFISMTGAISGIVGWWSATRTT